MTLDAWIGLYKLARMALLAGTLLAIALYLFAGSRRERLEAPARRALEEDG
jgi:hypothetical protein